MPLSADLEYLRTVLFPQVLQNVSENLNNFSELKIFELSNCYVPGAANVLPAEVAKLVGAVVLDAEPFLAAKGVVELLIKKLGIKNAQFNSVAPGVKFWQKHSALSLTVGKDLLGYVGIFSPDLVSHFDIDQPVAIFAFDFAALMCIRPAIPLPITSNVLSFLKFANLWPLKTVPIGSMKVPSSKDISSGSLKVPTSTFIFGIFRYSEKPPG